MKASIVLLCLIASTISGFDNKPKNANYAKKQSHLFGIKGGKRISIDERPYNVALNSKVKTFLGGGALITKNWVLTAGANVIGQKPNDVTVRIGSDDAYDGGSTVNVFDIITHPKYKGGWKYDLALVKLNLDVNITKNSKPIVVGRALPSDGTKTIVTGYGPTTYVVKTEGLLREATVPFMSYGSCKSKYETENTTFTSLSFCASKPGVGPCPLDWGDPLVYNNKLIGIFSGSKGDCGSAEYPGVYADVTQFRQWIRNTITP